MACARFEALLGEALVGQGRPEWQAAARMLLEPPGGMPDDWPTERKALIKSGQRLLMLMAEVVSDDTPDDIDEDELVTIREACLEAEKINRMLAKYVIGCERLVQARKSSRSDFMHTLEEIIGRCPQLSKRSFRDEWVDMNVEVGQVVFGNTNAPTEKELDNYRPGGNRSIDAKCRNFGGEIEEKVSWGWSEEDAITHTCLTGVVGAVIARAMNERSSRYAASTYGLVNALQRAAVRQDFIPDPVYYHMEGSSNSSYEKSQKFKTIETPDSYGFCGFTCNAELHVYDDIQMFPEDNEFYDRGKYVEGKPVYQLNNGDVLKVVSAPKDEQGLHTVVKTHSQAYRIPPNTLITLRKVHPPGSWEPYPGRRPNRRCIEVGVSYLPIASALATAEQMPQTDKTGAAPHKMGVRASQLNYEKRLVYMRGLADITGELVLTLEQEWMRGDTWKARNGQEFSSIAEYEYCAGPANSDVETFAGLRDVDHVGMTPEDFMHKINTFIGARGQEVGVNVENNNKHLLDKEEVLALRLYTGPAYQPINTWLREVGKLNSGLRSQLANSPGMTYAATTKHIVSGIRKLARVGNAKLDGCVLYRGISGVLPETFWSADDAGIVCATDLGFMSTSLNSRTPVHYMKTETPNLLWQIFATKEDNVAFHCGAVISELSQYSGEDEVLFPPLTMLKVRPRAEGEVTDGISPEIDGKQIAESKLRLGVQKLSQDGKEFEQIAVVPYFI